MELTLRNDQRALIPAAIGNLNAYCQAARNIPMLTADEERKLAFRLQHDNDLEAARRLVLSHLRFVVRIARGYNGYGLSQADLIQEGNIGLMKAVKRFDPEQGVRLVSFAVHWIRAEIHEFILRNWRIVKIATTKAQRKLFFNLRSAKKRLGWLNRKEVDGVARDLGVSPEQVMEMEIRLSSQDASFDGPSSEDAEEHTLLPALYLSDRTADPAQQLEQRDQEDHHSLRLRQALEKLEPRSREIINRRWLQEGKSTLHELAAEYRVSAERIRQLETSAIEKLRAMLPGQSF